MRVLVFGEKMRMLSPINGKQLYGVLIDMKTKIFITVLLFVFIGSNSFAQKVDFSSYLASGGGVHTSTPSVVDKNGNIFVAGGTREGLKVTSDAFQKNYKGQTENDATGGDAFLMKLSPKGELIYSTYLGGSGSEYYCLQMTIDDLGNVYVGFTTDSKDLPVSDNAYQKLNKGENDHYIIKFSNDCKYIASTYLGGSGGDHWTRLAVHKNTLYLFGKTKSHDFPATHGVFQKVYDNSAPPDSNHRWLVGDITITALSLSLDKVLCSTYLGGNSLDFIKSYSFGLDGKIILAGQTYSYNFPTTKNAYQKSMVGKEDGFLTIINKNLSKIYYSTFIGGDSTDQVNSIIVEDANNIVLAGQTKSPNFPITSDALYKKYIGGNSDGFIMKFNLTTNNPAYSSYIGGAKTDWLNYIAQTDEQKYVLVCTSSSIDFPVTKNALYKSISSGMDLVILLLDKTLKNIEYSTYGGGSKQRIMDPSVNYIKGGKLLISSMCISPDFPVTLKYTEPDNTWTNCMWKFDLNSK
ncbi:MAG: SBBP repeat-containing protein [Leadbetterella sp.]|nr:SBBP repeat-containing protein [Leadbetterella sp.]